MKRVIHLLTILLLFCVPGEVARAQSADPVSAGSGSAAAITPATVQDSSVSPKSVATSGAELLLRTNTGDMIPLSDLLGSGIVEEVLQRSQEQRSVPRYTIAELELSGVVDRDVVTLNLEMQIKVRPASEWITVPIAMGEVYVTKFSHSTDAAEGQAVLTSGDQTTRLWHLLGAGQHTVRMELVGKTRSVAPGISQMTLNLPTATASHANFSFSVPVELQKLPAGAVDKSTRDDQGVRSVEFWGLSPGFGLTWSEVAPQVSRKPVIQVQNRVKLDLTTIPVNFTGTQVLQISGSPVSEVRVTFPAGFQLQEIDARNAAGVSVLSNFESSSTSDAVSALIRLTSAMSGSLTLSFDLELKNRTFPQDIRVGIPQIQEANLQSGELDILSPTGLLVQQSPVEGAQRKRVTTETDLSVAATAFRMRSAKSEILLHVEETEAQFAVSPELSLQPEQQNVILTARYPVSVLKGSLLDFAIAWPGYSGGDWQILPGSPRLISDKTSQPLSLQESDSEPDVLQMTFPERQSGEFMVEFRAFATLSLVRSGAVQLHCPEVQSRPGQPFVLTTIESDEYSIRPISMGTGELLQRIPLRTPATSAQVRPGLTLESWLHDDPSIPIRLELPAQAPSVRAGILLGMKARENGLEVNETIRFEIEHRDLTSLSLQVPAGVRPTVRIPGQSEPLRASIESSSWSFRLPEARRGDLSIDVTYLWTMPSDAAQSSDHVYQLPIILPQAAEVRSVEAGTSMISGLRVSDEAAWRPVYSEKFEAAWRTTQPVAAIPIRWPDRQNVTVSTSPDLLLARTQIIGRQAITATLAVYQSMPDVITVETPEELGIEAIVLGAQSLTSGDLGRSLMQTTRINERGVIRWRIASGKLSAVPAGPVLLEFRLRQRLPENPALWLDSSFRRAVIVGESEATPVVWCITSQDEFQAIGASPEFASLTKRGATLIPGGATIRTIADRQMHAVLSPYPRDLELEVMERVDEWLSQSGRQDLFFGSADSGPLQLFLVPGVSLLLVSAVICVLFFVVMSLLRQITITVPLLFLTCVAMVAWLIFPEWTLTLAPYAAMGIVFGIVSISVQRLVSDGRVNFPKTSAKPGEYPTVFGFSGVVSSSGVVAHPETVSIDVSQQPEYSVGSSR
jgi:hypothetical protein